MAIEIFGAKFSQIGVIDDDERVRETYAEVLEDLKVKPVSFSDGFKDIASAIEHIGQECQGVLTDYTLQPSGYSPFDGGSLASECFKKKIPAILCSSYTDLKSRLSRRHRRWIPVVVPAKEMGIETLTMGFGVIVRELSGIVTQERKGWRSQIEVVETNDADHCFYVVVSGRSGAEKIKVFHADVPPDVQPLLKKGAILHALVNTGTKQADDLYFDEWEKA